jgi:competence protein ComEC
MDILCVSAALVLLVDPSSVFDVGFQLSCAAMLGIIVLGVPLCERWIEKPFLLRFLLNTITISVAAQLVTMPLTLLYFHSLATYSALTSILVIPLTTMILYASILVFCGASWMVPFLEAMISLQSQVMMLIAQLPGAYITF